MPFLGPMVISYFKRKKKKMKELREKRRELHYQQNRNFILEIAEDVFSRFGYSQTSMDLIAQETQFSKATLYRYFAGKQDLFFSVIQNSLGDLGVQLTAIQRKNFSPEEKIKKIVVAIFKFYHKKKNIGRALFLERMFARKRQEVSPGGHHPQIPNNLRKKLLELSETINEVIREGIDQGVFAPVDPEDASFILGSLVRGFVFRGPLGRKEYSPHQASELVSRYFLYGIARSNQPKKIS